MNCGSGARGWNVSLRVCGGTFAVCGKSKSVLLGFLEEFVKIFASACLFASECQRDQTLMSLPKCLGHCLSSLPVRLKGLSQFLQLLATVGTAVGRMGHGGTPNLESF